MQGRLSPLQTTGRTQPSSDTSRSQQTSSKQAGKANYRNVTREHSAPYSIKQHQSSKNCAICKKRLLKSVLAQEQSWIITHCQHRVCKPCIRAHTDNAERHAQPVTCPSCNTLQPPAVIERFKAVSLPPSREGETAKKVETTKEVETMVRVHNSHPQTAFRSSESEHPASSGRLTCPGCKQTTPHTGNFVGSFWGVTECGHMVCKPCIKKWVIDTQTNSCPACKTPQSPVTLGYFKQLGCLPSSHHNTSLCKRAVTAVKSTMSTLESIASTYFLGKTIYNSVGWPGLVIATGVCYVGKRWYHSYTENIR